MRQIAEHDRKTNDRKRIRLLFQFRLPYPLVCYLLDKAIFSILSSTRTHQYTYRILSTRNMFRSDDKIPQDT